MTKNDIRWGLLTFALALVGCGDDDRTAGTAAQAAVVESQPAVVARTQDPAPATVATTPVEVEPEPESEDLVVKGVPASAAAVGRKYSFRPTVVTANGKLEFEIANKPKWATFSAATGQLTGTPGPNDVGTSKNIAIQVTDGENYMTLPVFSITVPPVALGSATLSWSPPTQDVSGDQITNLGGYKIYWGTAIDDLSNSATINNVGLSRYVVENLAPGKYFFTMTAFDRSGTESGRAAITSKTIT